jgi:hypothetical protein
VIGPGTVITGGVVSRSVTVTVKLALPVLPAWSVAVQVTEVVPSGKVEPEDGLHVGVSAPSTLSFAVAVNVTAFPSGFEVVVEMFDGTVTTGFVVSSCETVTVN